MQTDVEVYRRMSPNQPSLEDSEIDWEETVYLNLILQHVSNLVPRETVYNIHFLINDHCCCQGLSYCLLKL